MKRIFLLALLLIAIFGCKYEKSGEAQQQEQTEQAYNEMQKQLGMPNIVNFQERKLAKMIFELRDKEDLITYAYVVSKNTGELKFIGKCIGYGLPYSIQYTNPEKLVNRYGEVISMGEEAYSLPQADPNGLYMPQGLSATWLMMIDKNGEARPVYIEPEIIVSPFELR